MIRGGLFSRFFLEDGIRDTDDYRALDSAQVLAFADDVRGLWQQIEPMPHPNEDETEREFIFPVFDRLGWHHLPQQTPGRGRHDVADALLFLSEADKDTARRLASVDRFRHGAVVVENEARDTPLDRASGQGEAPSSQILRYLGRAEGQSGGVVRWGLLTNGRSWRLYWAQARARAEGIRRTRPARPARHATFGAGRGTSRPLAARLPPAVPLPSIRPTRAGAAELP